MLISLIQKEPYIKKTHVSKHNAPNFKGHYEKISTTPPPAAEKIVQVYGAASSIPTSLKPDFLKSLSNSLLNRVETDKHIREVAIKNEENILTKELLKKIPTEKLDSTLSKMKDYALAEELCEILAEKGYGVLTGDARGSMEAAKKGAHKRGGYCIGVALKGEEIINKYLDEVYTEDTWRTRLNRFNEKGKAPFTIVMPGGEGSISKLWDKLLHNIIDYREDPEKKPPKKLILIDKEYWQPMIDWLKGQPSKREYVRSFNYDMIKLVDNADEFRSVLKQIKA